jgi:hypothetical protein
MPDFCRKWCDAAAARERKVSAKRVLLERSNGGVGVADQQGKGGIQIQASKPDERKASRAAAWTRRRAKGIHLREASKGAKQLAQSWKAPADSMHELAKDHCFPWQRKAEVKSRKILLRSSASNILEFSWILGAHRSILAVACIITEFRSRSVTERNFFSSVIFGERCQVIYTISLTPTKQFETTSASIISFEFQIENFRTTSHTLL